MSKRTYIEQFWRAATASDFAKVVEGETVVARFRAKVNSPSGWTAWTSASELAGIKKSPRGGFLWASPTSEPLWEDCQVYDLPEWWINKPDPGQGYRLLEKWPQEVLLDTDEAWLPCIDPTGCPWQPVNYTGGEQLATVWYRRKIQTKESRAHYVLRPGDTVMFAKGASLVSSSAGTHWEVR